jgi:DNA repair protein RadC
MNYVNNEDRAQYLIAISDDETARGDRLIAEALLILSNRVSKGLLADSQTVIKDYLRLKMAQYDREVFAVLLLDAQNRVIHEEELFFGTLTQTAVYPREVVKLALKHNAAGALFCHNHPSGTAEPSRADELLTNTLTKALTLIDVKVLDHIVVATGAAVSMAERGLL